MNSGVKVMKQDLKSLITNSISHIKNPIIQKNINIRRKLIACIRGFMISEKFEEFDTPLLSGKLREYSAGQFTALSELGQRFHLAQSPQFFKQLLMASGIERYFQFSHCFRDEPYDPTRRDRMREFIQFDFEMGATDTDQIVEIVEKLTRHICHEFNLDANDPFVRMSFDEAISNYGTDRPNLLNQFSKNTFVWVKNFPLASKTESGEIKLCRHPMAKPCRMPASKADACEVYTHSFDLVLNGYEIGSGDLRIEDADSQKYITEIMGLESADFEPLVEVLSHGCPPHGGVGIGLDRLAMVLCLTDDIANVTAFPDWFGCMHREPL